MRNNPQDPQQPNGPSSQPSGPQPCSQKGHDRAEYVAAGQLLPSEQNNLAENNLASEAKSEGEISQGEISQGEISQGEADFGQSGVSVAEIREMLQAAGLRSTAPRIIVLQHLSLASHPTTHAELADKLVPQGFDRTTVYRNLIALSEAGLVNRLELGDHVWRFELARHAPDGSPIDHPHLICSACGEVVCLHGTQISIEPPQSSPRPDFSVEEVVVKGVCNRCR